MYGYYREKLHFDHFWDLRGNGDLTMWCQYATSVWWKVLWFSQNYVEQLLEHRCIVLCGQQGLGKSYLASKLAEHVVQRQVNFLKNLQTLLSIGLHNIFFVRGLYHVKNMNLFSLEWIILTRLVNKQWWTRTCWCMESDDGEGGGCTESDDGGRGLILFLWEFDKVLFTLCRIGWKTSPAVVTFNVTQTTRKVSRPDFFLSFFLSSFWISWNSWIFFILIPPFYLIFFKWFI